MVSSEKPERVRVGCLPARFQALSMIPLQRGISRSRLTRGAEADSAWVRVCARDGCECMTTRPRSGTGTGVRSMGMDGEKETEGGSKSGGMEGGVRWSEGDPGEREGREGEGSGKDRVGAVKGLTLHSRW